MAEPTSRVEVLGRALDRAVEQGDDRRACAVAMVLGHAAESAGDVNVAVDRFRQASRHGTAAGWAAAVAEAELRCARLKQTEGRGGRDLLEHLEAATRALTEAGVGGEVAASAWGGLGAVRLALEDADGAASAFATALDAVPAADAEGLRARCLVGQGAALELLGRAKEAVTALEEGLALDAGPAPVLPLELRRLAREHVAWLKAELSQPAAADYAALAAAATEPAARLRLLIGHVAALNTSADSWSPAVDALADAAEAAGDRESALFARLDQARRADGAPALTAAIDLAEALGRADLAASLRRRAAELELTAATAADSIDLAGLARAEALFAAARVADGVLHCARLRLHAQLAAGDLAAVADTDPDAVQATPVERLHIVAALSTRGRLAEAAAQARALVRTIEAQPLAERDAELVEVLALVARLAEPPVR